MSASDGPVLLRRILDDPADTALRLVYADWLDEHDDPDRAEFIRVQCQLAEWSGPRVTPDRSFAGRPRCDAGWCASWQPCDRCLAWKALTDRERDLLLGPKTERGRDNNADRWTARTLQRADNNLYWDRGFVSVVACTEEQLFAFASTLFAAHPITRVDLLERDPDDAFGTTGVWWTSNSGVRPFRNGLKPSLFDLLPEAAARYVRDRCHYYEDASTAREAASVACVTYGRRCAHLDPLYLPRRAHA